MISIVIPLYNVEKYVIECLDSISNQTYKDFELIIVNDGSTDRSSNIVQEYMKSGSMKIKLLHQKNAGVSAARNRGLDEAEGDYICFIDPDDMVAPNYLEKMVNTFEGNKCDLVICGFKSVPENLSIDEYTFSQQEIEVFDSYEALKKFLYHEVVSGVCFIMVRKELLDKGKLRFTEGYRYSEDLEMIWKMLACSNTVAYDKTQLYLYRLRNGSAMSVVDEKRMDGLILMMGIEKFLEQNRPDFSKLFKKFGIARWIWATLWQVAMTSDNYQAFKNLSSKFSPEKYIKRLVVYPKFYVACSSFLYCLSPFLYYKIFKIVGMAKFKKNI